MATQEEKQANELMDPEDRPDFMPTAFDSLRQVPCCQKQCIELHACVTFCHLLFALLPSATIALQHFGIVTL
jgi:hypothetical protein